MPKEDKTSRKEFFQETFSFFKKGITSHIDEKLHKTLDGPVRPPGAMDEIEFLSTCTRCDDCMNACKPRAIKKMSLQSGIAANTPYIDSRDQPCLLCEDFPCILSCRVDALKLTEWRHSKMGCAFIDQENCLTYKNKVCTLCYDACPYPEDAITIGDDFHPIILEKCCGCGACENKCPNIEPAVKVFSPTKQRKAKKSENIFEFNFSEKKL